MWAAAAMVALLLGLCLYSRACGPFFPNSILQAGDARLTECPLGEFGAEMERLAPREAPRYKSKTPKGQDLNDGNRVTAVELADLAAAMKEDRTPADQARKMLDDYKLARLTIQEFVEKKKQWESVPEEERGDAPRLRNVKIPADLPVGFGKYLEGAVLYHQGKLKEARAAWQAVVDVSSPHRAVWAAYMIALSYLHQEGEDEMTAIKLFPRVRQLVDGGFEDSLGLACESLGWEARANLNLGRYDRAVELYFQQFAAGDPMAVWSLRDTAAEAFADNDAKTLNALAKSVKVRPVVAAYILARGGPYRGGLDEDVAGLWLEAVEKANVVGAREADRFAWAAYQLGDANAAQRWVDRAPEGAPIANWVRGKLLLRQGKLDAAAEKLALAVRAMPRDANADKMHDHLSYPWPPRTEGPAEWAAGELAVLRLARSQYTEAMDLLLRYGWWEDAAYVAERVLTSGELRTYVDKNLREPYKPQEGTPLAAEEDLAKQIRHLLARRLAREGQFDSARLYLPEEFRPAMKDYAEALALARDPNRRQDKRANAFIKAARIARWKGMQLLATELGPDGHIDEGQFEGSDFAIRTDANLTVPSRQAPEAPIAPGTDAYLVLPGPREPEVPIAPPTNDERQRVAGSLPQPNERFHYRYVAAELMWQAAALMPDGNERTAYVLCEGGTWLKARDPNAALRFYKAMVSRCGDTPLGRKAKDLHWFPPLPMAPASAPSTGQIPIEVPRAYVRGGPCGSCPDVDKRIHADLWTGFSHPWSGVGDGSHGPPKT